MKALAWATQLDDDALLVGLAGPLPEAVLEEQLRLYEASQAFVAQPPKVPEALLVYAHLFSSRMQAAAAFYKSLPERRRLGARRADSTRCMPDVYQ